MHKMVISNTSPLYYLHNIGKLDILHDLYGKIYIPDAVLIELSEGLRVGVNVPLIEDISWIEIKQVKVPRYINLIPDLGKGEAEAIALSCEDDNSLLIVDDMLGRKIAKLQDIRITGTAGILLKAKKEKLIKELVIGEHGCYCFYPIGIS
ncbi:MAG: DUF3368 domain-containing protein [Spirochaetota bacterium]|nr:DUF3368 domain-containing protein [Spirochaetota bacterium]